MPGERPQRGRGKSRPKPVHRQIRSETEQLAVWVGWRIAGARATGRVHRVDDETVRRVARRVEADPALLARAEELLADANAGHKSECTTMLAAARRQLAAVLAVGDVHPRELIRAIEVLTPMAGAGEDGKGLGAGLVLPTYLNEPRVDAPPKGST